MNIDYVYTLINGEIPVVVDGVIKHNKSICEKSGLDFKVIEYDVNAGESPAGKSDLVRFGRAAQFPRTLYVDWDCKILKIPEADPNKPMVYQLPKSIVRDSFAVYNGDKAGIFDDLLLLLESGRGTRGWWGCHVLPLNSDDFRAKIGVFPDGCFEHLGLRLGMKVKA